MNHDVIDRLVRPANPVPDPRMLGAIEVSDLHVRRSEVMQTQKVEAERVQAGRSRNLVMGIAAFVLVIVGGLVIFQITRDSDTAAPPTPIGIAATYLRAYAAFDVEAVESMLAPDANVLPWESYEPRDWKSDLRYLEAAGFQLTFGECTELSPVTDGDRVNCQYEAHGLGSDQIGEGPFGGHTFQLVIADGLVVSSGMGFNFSDFSGTMWYPFQQWIQDEHPEDYAVLYVNSGLSRQTEEAIALWEERVAEYVEYNNSQP